MCVCVCVCVCLIYMYKQDLVLNNLQCLICHKTKPNETNLSNVVILLCVYIASSMDKNQKFLRLKSFLSEKNKKKNYYNLKYEEQKL